MKKCRREGRDDKPPVSVGLGHWYFGARIPLGPCIQRTGNQASSAVLCPWEPANNREDPCTISIDQRFIDLDTPQQFRGAMHNGHSYQSHGIAKRSFFIPPHIRPSSPPLECEVNPKSTWHSWYQNWKNMEPRLLPQLTSWDQELANAMAMPPMSRVGNPESSRSMISPRSKRTWWWDDWPNDRAGKPCSIGRSAAVQDQTPLTSHLLMSPLAPPKAIPLYHTGPVVICEPTYSDTCLGLTSCAASLRHSSAPGDSQLYTPSCSSRGALVVQQVPSQPSGSSPSQFYRIRARTTSCPPVCPSYEDRSTCQTSQPVSSRDGPSCSLPPCFQRAIWEPRSTIIYLTHQRAGLGLPCTSQSTFNAPIQQPSFVPSVQTKPTFPSHQNSPICFKSPNELSPGEQYSCNHPCNQLNNACLLTCQEKSPRIKRTTNSCTPRSPIQQTSSAKYSPLSTKVQNSSLYTAKGRFASPSYLPKSRCPSQIGKQKSCCQSPTCKQKPQCPPSLNLNSKIQNPSQPSCSPTPQPCPPKCVQKIKETDCRIPPTKPHTLRRRTRPDPACSADKKGSNKCKDPCKKKKNSSSKPPSVTQAMLPAPPCIRSPCVRSPAVTVLRKHRSNSETGPKRNVNNCLRRSSSSCNDLSSGISGQHTKDCMVCCARRTSSTRKLTHCTGSEHQRQTTPILPEQQRAAAQSVMSDELLHNREERSNIQQNGTGDNRSSRQRRSRHTVIRPTSDHTPAVAPPTESNVRQTDTERARVAYHEEQVRNIACTNIISQPQPQTLRCLGSIDTSPTEVGSSTQSASMRKNIPTQATSFTAQTRNSSVQAATVTHESSVNTSDPAMQQRTEVHRAISSSRRKSQLEIPEDLSVTEIKAHNPCSLDNLTSETGRRDTLSPDAIAVSSAQEHTTSAESLTRDEWVLEFNETPLVRLEKVKTRSPSLTITPVQSDHVLEAEVMVLNFAEGSIESSIPEVKKREVRIINFADSVESTVPDEYATSETEEEQPTTGQTDAQNKKPQDTKGMESRTTGELAKPASSQQRESTEFESSTPIGSTETELAGDTTTPMSFTLESSSPPYS